MIAVCSLQAQAETIPIIESHSSPLILSDATSDARAPRAMEGGVLLEKIYTLQREVLQLRGLVEEQGDALQRLAQENWDRYLDMDRRIAGLSSTTRNDERDTGALSSGAGVPDNVSEQVIYEKAYQLIRLRKFDEAIVALNDYVSRFSKGEYLDNAQYWLGEVYYAKGQFEQSKSAFEAVLKNYPDSGKLPDAMYKLGRVFDQLGDKAQSEKYMRSVIRQYSQSSAARLADAYLRNMKAQSM